MCVHKGIFSTLWLLWQRSALQGRHSAFIIHRCANPCKTDCPLNCHKFVSLEVELGSSAKPIERVAGVERRRLGQLLDFP